MAVLIGIDEAGYGPMLGPLVMTAIAFQVPDEHADTPMWKLLTGSVRQRSKGRDARLLITDSKKAHSQAKGIADLEAAVLSVLRVGGRKPTRLGKLLGILSPEVPAQLGDYPWYKDFDAELPATCQAERIKLHANALAKDMAAAKVRFLGAWSEILPVGQFNERVAQTRNKAVVLSDLTMRLIVRANESLGATTLAVFIDKQGGRDLYGPTLMRCFEFADLRIIEEGPEQSRYQLVGQPTNWTISYLSKGEDRHLPIALASMFSKYLRELFMMGFNQYWRGRLADLTPTAGYYRDARRFLHDIDAEIRRLNLPNDLLVRSR